jgi:hypothetical protein
MESTYRSAKRSGGFYRGPGSGREMRGTMKRSGAAPDQSCRRTAASRIEQPFINAARSRMLPPGRFPRAGMPDIDRHDHTFRATLTAKLSRLRDEVCVGSGQRPLGLTRFGGQSGDAAALTDAQTPPAVAVSIVPDSLRPIR